MNSWVVRTTGSIKPSNRGRRNWSFWNQSFERIANLSLENEADTIVKAIHELQVPGLVNVDFADVRAIMANAGSSLMGIGTATGNS
ncbi:hypothetical protein GIB67_029556 [Kingdonia uniflora]|uniref:Uncharacterized protein n=1 Tax=Kingdonia uniflora TaxID=39325 RepID=A0A7J7NYY0_9MAGN|nr:hypothetical protein GIB67_029556 [Kingdonia uniflora]